MLHGAGDARFVFVNINVHFAADAEFRKINSRFHGVAGGGIRWRASCVSRPSMLTPLP